ncbi:MAG: heavy-metal-associated domain-containing protein [Flavobacteriales bacterium]|nr:heavy-metal-associated domain-containing protein [Flavobacteriales bacterium]
MKKLILLSFLFATTTLVAQEKQPEQPADKNLAQLDIRTSTVCDMCEKTIEENLIYEKGVKKVDVDLAKSEIHVQYDPRKNDPDALRKAVSKMGYMADDIPGDEAAFKKLPLCCQKEGCGKPAGK